MKKITLFLFLTIFSLAFTLNVNAQTEAKLNVSANEVNLGQEIIVTIDLNKEEEQTSLLAYTAKLSYDKNVFEVIKEEDFQEQENWSGIVYNEKNNKFALVNKQGISGQNIVQIKLKVKEDATPGKTDITLNSIKASDGTRDISFQSRKAEITVTKNGLAQGESIPSNKELQSVQEENTSIKAEKTFPWLVIILVLLIIAIIIFIIYYNTKSNEKKTPKGKKITIIVIAIIVLILLLIYTIKILFGRNADVNKDGNVDYQDSKEIMEYLLEIKSAQDDENISDKDVNKDGEITITDVAQTTDKSPNTQQTPTKPSTPSTPETPDKPETPETPDTPQQPDNPQNPDNPDNPDNPQNPDNPDNPDNPEQPQEYNLTINSIKVSNYIPKKLEEITLDLYMDVTPYKEIEEVEIEGKFYPVEKVALTRTSDQETNHYKLTIPAPNTAGIQKLTVTSVKPNDVKKVDTNNDSVTIDVLKDKPTIQNFKINAEEEIAQISFTIQDEDEAFKSANFVIVDEDENIVYESIEGEIYIGENTVIANLVEGKSYEYKLLMDYDLDHNYFEEDVAKDQEIYDDLIFDVNKEFTRDFNFIGKDFTLTQTVKEDDDLILTFKNDYNSYYNVKTIIIDGTEYEVEGPDDNGIYTVIVNKSSTKGTHTINIESVTLENDETTYYDVKEQLSYIYLKNTPIVDIEAQLNDSILSFTVNTQDVDKAIKEVTVYLKDSKNDELESLVLENTDSGSFELKTAGEYTLEVEVKYDLGNGEQTTTKVYDKQTIKEPIKVKNITAKLPQYVQKGEDVEIIFTIEDNTNQEITDILINGINNLTIQKQQDGTYKLVIPAPTDSGIITYEVSKLYYGEEEATVECELTFEVLKTAPIVTNDYVELDTSANPTLHFELIDEEDTFISGKVIVIAGEYEIPFTKSIGTNAIQVELENIEEFVDYRLEIEVTYGLDTDKTEQNRYTKILEDHDLLIEKNYNFELKDFILKEITPDVVTLQFTSTNTTKGRYYVEKVIINDKTYTVERNDTTYTVKVPTQDFEQQRTVLNLEEAILGNLMGFDKTIHFADIQSILVFKTHPTATVSNIKTTVDKLSDIKAEVNIIDDDNTISKVYAVLKDADGNEIGTPQEITLINNKAEVEFQVNKAGTYTIEVLADYNAVDGLNHTKEAITTGEKQVAIEKWAKVENIESNNYAKKGENVELTITIDSNTDENLLSVEINNENKTYTVEKQSNGVYKVIVTVPDKTGDVQYKVTKINYTDKTIQITDSPVKTIYVLKTAPEITSYIFDDIVEPPTITLTFTDPENTLVGKGYVVIKDSVNKQEVTKQEIVLNGETVIVSKGLLTKGSKYLLTLEGIYDLDEDKNNTVSESTNTYSITDLLEEKEIEMLDYKTSINDLKVANEGVDNKNKQVTFTFTAKVEPSKLNVTEIIVEGTHQKVEGPDENGRYTATIPYTQDDNKKVQITIEGVELNNGKVITFEEEQKVKFEIFKLKPTATKPTATVSEDQFSITALTKVTDEDSTIQKVYAVLKDTNSQQVGEPVEAQLNEEGKYEAKIDVEYAGEYTIEIRATYNRLDGEEHVKEIISESDSEKITVNKSAKILSNKLSTHYPDKGAKVVITYEIKDNIKEDLQNICINNENYPVTKNENGTYSITYVEKTKTPGVQTLTTSKLLYAENIQMEVSKTDKIDVLKTMPYVSLSTYRAIQNYDERKITFEFTIVDVDNILQTEEDGVTIKDAYASFGPYVSEEGTSNPRVKIGPNKITFVNIKAGGSLYLFQTTIQNIDLDSNQLNGELGKNDNFYSSKGIGRIGAALIKPTTLHVSNLIIHSEDGTQTTSLTKNQKFKLSFTADAYTGDKKEGVASKYYPTSIKIKDGDTYELERSSNTYTTKTLLSGYSEIGKKTIQIESVELNNGEIVTLTDTKTTVEVVE